MANGLDLVAVGAAVRRLRQAKQLTLEEVSASSGVNTGNLSRIERGGLGWSLDTLASIARVLQVPLAELISEAERGVGVGVSTEIAVAVPILKLEDLKGSKLQQLMRKSTEHVKTTAPVGPAAFAFRYSGGAMPEFRQGELIIIDPAVDPVYGHLVLVQTDEGVIFRVLETDGDMPHLVARNKQYPAILLNPRKHKILGVARQAIRNL